MVANKDVRVIELRNYLIKPGMRDSFIGYFKQHFTSSQDCIGGFALGEFRIKGADNRFFWVRGFENMKTRSLFLPAFYGGDTWREFGPAANEMMLEWHNVYLLRPLKKAVSSDAFNTYNGFVVIDFYTAKDGQLDKLVDFFETAYLPFLQACGIAEPSLWITEMEENDFPKLPVIQNSHLLVTLTSFRDEEEYREKSAQTFFGSFGSKNQLQEIVHFKESILLYKA